MTSSVAAAGRLALLLTVSCSLLPAHGQYRDWNAVADYSAPSSYSSNSGYDYYDSRGSSSPARQNKRGYNDYGSWDYGSDGETGAETPSWCPGIQKSLIPIDTANRCAKLRLNDL
ncbi:hypothetical protein FJT64_017842 [Amphibalanus amphitrite]|uniref:Uncharacterized protein n=1 Tax=Amphibalanus amphitrite TaxID=1232801 RepID=A0A6A4XAG0_AMPAM|nr:hypothetical protein FJT64_017842 [Amphibalanus amphitrite]